MKWKSIFCAAALAAVLTAAAGAALFPVAETRADGTTAAGYMDESGRLAIPMQYTAAEPFADCGLAAVRDAQGRTALLDEQGKTIVQPVQTPLQIVYGADEAAFCYGDRTEFYDKTGTLTGTYPLSADGRFADGLLLCQNASGAFFYVDRTGAQPFDKTYLSAGAFVGGRALVQLSADSYAVIDTTGAELYRLESRAHPVYMTIFEQDTIIVALDDAMALYSLAAQRYMTAFVYQSISPFDGGAAAVQQSGRFGLISPSGREIVSPQYSLMTPMGDGVFAARLTDGSVAAVDATGATVYRTPEYVGGFTAFACGLGWHGTAENSLIFFRRNGGYYASVANASAPVVLTEHVVRVTQDGAEKYVNLDTGKTLFAPQTRYTLAGGLNAETTTYEKFMGFAADGSEYGWNVRFPMLSGMADTAVQDKVNAAIRSFFLKGAANSAEYDALEGGYGLSVEGSLLVVWADCISGKGQGAAVWNESVTIDLRTGAVYTIDDLLGTGYTDIVRQSLPAGHELYRYSYPRISTQGVTFYYNEYETTGKATTEELLIPYSALRAVLKKDGACYAALSTPFGNTGTGFSDVSGSYWAAGYIETVRAAGLMKGDTGGTFRPEDAITGGEVCATMARALGISGSRAQPMPNTNQNAWYAAELNGVYNAGLLDGVQQFDATHAMTRAQAMTVFGNLLRRQGGYGAVAEEETYRLFAPFADANKLPDSARDSVALCIKAGIINGDDGLLNPNGAFTRAQFAKLLALGAVDETM